MIKLFGSTIILLLLQLSYQGENFRECNDARILLSYNIAYCRRNRDFANSMNENSNSFLIKENQYKLSEGPVFVANLSYALLPLSILQLSCSIYDFGILRCGIEEIGPHKRFKVSDFGPVVIDSQVGRLALKLVKQANSVLISADKDVNEFTPSELHIKVNQSKINSYAMEVTLKPFKLKYLVNKEVVAVVNDKNFLNYELYRTREEHQMKIDKNEIIDATAFESDIDNLYIDKFAYQTHDIAKGPTSVGLDFTFPESSGFYGLPIHTTSFKLEETTDGEPYRFFNTDVYNYPTNSRGTIYGSIPYILSQSKRGFTEMIWLNAADTWIDIKNSPHNIAHWMSEAGSIEFFLFAADTAQAIVVKSHLVFGKSPMPLYAALGYHQSRYSYASEEEIKNIDKTFDDKKIPYDSIWLDIFHTVNKKYFTWNKENFRDPIGMQELLRSKSRFVVAIADPHISDDLDYQVYSEGLGKSKPHNEIFVMNEKRELFHGRCWPGSSVYIDFFNENARQYWIDLVVNHPDSTDNLFLWNDMNEPSVFDSIEMTMPKHCLYI